MIKKLFQVGPLQSQTLTLNSGKCFFFLKVVPVPDIGEIS